MYIAGNMVNHWIPEKTMKFLQDLPPGSEAAFKKDKNISLLQLELDDDTFLNNLRSMELGKDKAKYCLRIVALNNKIQKVRYHDMHYVSLFHTHFLISIVLHLWIRGRGKVGLCIHIRNINPLKQLYVSPCVCQCIMRVSISETANSNELNPKHTGIFANLNIPGGG